MKVALSELNVETDKILKELYLHMSFDLAYLGIEGKPWNREFSYPLNKWSNPYVYKAKYQLNTLMKRFVTKEELENEKVNKKAAYRKFAETQVRLCGITNPKSSTFKVLQRARGIIKNILGKFDTGKHIEFCRFGRRSAVGMTYSESYLDVRVSTLTGSKDHIQWFKNKVIPQDDLLSRSIKGSYTVTESLTLTDVPKTWDKRRTILKNTVIGGFYAAGLGDYMVECLSLSGIKLARTADKHRRVIKKFSRTMSHATADLSAASDSFTWSLMARLFPRDWLNAMNFGRIRNVKILKESYATTSFMTMGIGFTFPAQTIAFYAVLKAIKELTGIKGMISVFGDDLIYPTKMHSYAEGVLTDLGFLINTEKTFTDTPFRESCGADYYDGVDVRPFQPEGGHEILVGAKALSFLYKMYNGLQLRWEKCELPNAFTYLLGQIHLFTKLVHQVPLDYPVTSGIQTAVVLNDPGYHPVYTSKHGDAVFLSLSHKGRIREVPLQTPYLWESLRQMSRGGKLNWEDRFMDPADSTILQWKWMKKRKSRHNKSPIYYHRLVPCVTRKGSDPTISESWNLTCRFNGAEVLQ